MAIQLRVHDLRVLCDVWRPTWGSENYLEQEKVSKTEAGWINGGFFVCEPEVFEYIAEEETCIFEQIPLQQLATDGKMAAYKHQGFWQPMDTLRDNQKLNKLWKENKAPWKVW